MWKILVCTPVIKKQNQTLVKINSNTEGEKRREGREQDRKG